MKRMFEICSGAQFLGESAHNLSLTKHLLGICLYQYI